MRCTKTLKFSDLLQFDFQSLAPEDDLVKLVNVICANVREPSRTEEDTVSEESACCLSKMQTLRGCGKGDVTARLYGFLRVYQFLNYFHSQSQK